MLQQQPPGLLVLQLCWWCCWGVLGLHACTGHWDRAVRVVMRAGVGLGWLSSNAWCGISHSLWSAVVCCCLKDIGVPLRAVAAAEVTSGSNWVGILCFCGCSALFLAKVAVCSQLTQPNRGDPAGFGLLYTARISNLSSKSNEHFTCCFFSEQPRPFHPQKPASRQASPQPGWNISQRRP